jgi:hypothetical protein
MEFSPDGKPGDPLGVSALALWGPGTAKAILNQRPLGVGSEFGPAEQGRWFHNLIRADGTSSSLSADLRTYRIHDGDTDTWRWDAGPCDHA